MNSFSVVKYSQMFSGQSRKHWDCKGFDWTNVLVSHERCEGSSATCYTWRALAWWYVWMNSCLLHVVKDCRTPYHHLLVLCSWQFPYVCGSMHKLRSGFNPLGIPGISGMLHCEIADCANCFGWWQLASRIEHQEYRHADMLLVSWFIQNFMCYLDLSVVECCAYIPILQIAGSFRIWCTHEPRFQDLGLVPVCSHDPFQLGSYPTLGDDTPSIPRPSWVSYIGWVLFMQHVRAFWFGRCLGYVSRVWKIQGIDKWKKELMHALAEAALAGGFALALSGQDVSRMELLSSQSIEVNLKLFQATGSPTPDSGGGREIIRAAVISFFLFNLSLYLSIYLPTYLSIQAIFHRFVSAVSSEANSWLSVFRVSCSTST